MRPTSPPALAAAVALGLAAVAGTGCQPRALLSAVAVEPAAISPNGDGEADVARIRYAVGQTAHVTVRLEGADGASHVLRDAVLRQPRDDYALYFGGTLDGRMLPDGDYVLFVTAEPVGGGAPAEASQPMTIREADDSPPELIGFAVQPQRFSPNQDGIDDRVRITYRLDEPAEVRVWIEHADGTLLGDILAETEFADRPGDVGPHVYEYDAGVDADAPPPDDGEYAIVGEARDAVGNVARARVPLTIVDGGQAHAALVGDIVWSATLLPLGETLTFTATVRNSGDAPIRTRGPEPGTVYDNARSYNAVAPGEWLLLARDGQRSVARRIPFGAVGPVAIDLAAPSPARAAGPLRIERDAEASDREAVTGATNSDVDSAALDDGAASAADSAAATGDDEAAASEGDDRTSLGEGEVAAEDTAATTSAASSVCGTVTADGVPAPDAAVWLFEADGDNGRRAVVAADGGFCFDDVVPTPAYQRSFARSSGVVRLGLEYEDKATDLEYPYRWQLGRSEELTICEADGTAYLCLAPRQEVTISGSIRFVEPPLRRSTAIYASLMHEDVKRMHGPYGRQGLEIDFEADDAP